MTEYNATISAAAGRAQAILQDVERRWNAAAQAWNADELASLYASEALFFGGRPGHAVGQREILGYFLSYAGVLRSVAMSLVNQTVIELGADTLLAQGHAKFRFVLVDGGETVAELRTTWVMVRRQGTWLILQHHFSPTPEAPPIQ